ncbi:HD domain-containing protein [Hungatella effluvii]|uniref:HD domain-containing protein n=1 Tax=Hungatella effluvii TaxID=1096246 RepID=UPI0022DEF320|nr:HD domain-containing protein [Hungatella effluvii]
MNKEEYRLIDIYMKSCFDSDDYIHGIEHTYRVLHNALEIADHIDEKIDYDILIASCLLHDIGRSDQNKAIDLCHAQVGSKKAYEFLQSLGWDEAKSKEVAKCIMAHRQRKGVTPESVEAKILYDADKLDSLGAIGIARILMYGGLMKEPLVLYDENNHIEIDPTNNERSSFFQEYNLKRNASFYTGHAEKIANLRIIQSELFYKELYNELNESIINENLNDYLEM